MCTQNFEERGFELPLCSDCKNGDIVCEGLPFDPNEDVKDQYEEDYLY